MSEVHCIQIKVYVATVYCHNKCKLFSYDVHRAICFDCLDTFTANYMQYDEKQRFTVVAT